MIGIIAYANINPAGFMAQDLRKHLHIEHQLSIYDYDLSGFDEDMAFGTYLNGQPQDKLRQDRWQWEVQRDDLQFWKEERDITTAILVGSTYGMYTVAACKAISLKVIYIPFSETYYWPLSQHADLTICTSLDTASKIPMQVKKTLLHWPETNEAWELLRPMWASAIAGVAA